MAEIAAIRGHPRLVRAQRRVQVREVPCQRIGRQATGDRSGLWLGRHVASPVAAFRFPEPDTVSFFIKR
ncbi:hypothetical protein MBELCI_0595 [Limimaricola cinnabarinus LL-001]|uniref:Uncharacterized protein n=1 Tax=Limimaricola cinnabarinus LL-001 TaxID=1337093 RepID=U3AIB4_9RHOB|nr:hypothetical protein MBELCI_0595 [Limimaricola cinnabarinus LL-001]